MTGYLREVAPNCSTTNNGTLPFSETDCAPAISTLVFVEIIVLPIVVFLILSVSFYLWKKYWFSAQNLNRALEIHGSFNP